jgi:hypothetical protein
LTSDIDIKYIDWHPCVTNGPVPLILNYFAALSLQLRIVEVLQPLNARQISMGNLPHCWVVTVTTTCMGGHWLGNTHDDPCMLQDMGYFVLLLEEGTQGGNKERNKR